MMTTDLLDPMEAAALAWVENGGTAFYVASRRMCEVRGWISEGGKLTDAGREALRGHRAAKRMERLRFNVLPSIKEDERQALRELARGDMIPFVLAHRLAGHACVTMGSGGFAVTTMGLEVLALI